MLIISSPLPHIRWKDSLFSAKFKQPYREGANGEKTSLKGRKVFDENPYIGRSIICFYIPPIFIFYSSFPRKALSNLRIHQSKSIIGRKLFKYWCRSQCPAPWGIGLIMNLQSKRMMGHHLFLITNYDIVDTWISNLKQHALIYYLLQD